MIGDEAFYFIDGDSLIHAAAGAFLFTLLVADTAAYCGQRVFGLDKIQCFLVSSLCRHLQITLNRDVSRACHFTGRRTGRHDILTVLTVIRVPCSFGNQVIGQLGVFRSFQFALGAQFLSETQSVCRTGFDALCAGDTFCFVDLSDEVGTDGIAGTEHQADAQAVADSSTFAGFFDVGNIMHQAILFSSVNDLQCLFLTDLTGTAGADVMLCAFAHLDTHLFRQMSASVIDGAAGRAAGTGRHAELVIFVEIVAEPLIVMDIGNVLNGALDGNNSHQTVTVWDEWRHGLHTDTGIFLKCFSDFRMGIQKFLVVDQHLHDAGCEDLHKVNIFATLLVIRAAEHTDPCKMLGQFFHFVHWFSDFLCQITDCPLLAEACSDSYIGFIIRQDACQTVVLRCIFIDLVDNTSQSSDDMAKPNDLWS